VNQLFLGHTAGAGAPYQDAWLTMLHVGNGGMCFIDSVELDEVYTPIHVYTRRLIPDSEGAGRYRGAPGIEVEFGPVDCRMEAGFVHDGNIHVPEGARAGLPAARSSAPSRPKVAIAASRTSVSECPRGRKPASASSPDDKT
jgi:N-methylhydantoinase B